MILSFFLHFCGMFNQLRQRWKVSSLNLALIITTFALGGSLCGWAGKKIMSYTGLEKDFTWLIVYLIIVTLLWPLCVLVVSIPLGQAGFFKNYLLKIWGRITGQKNKPVSIAIFASGAGSNAQKIIQHFKENKQVAIGLVVCNEPSAGVIKIARAANIPVLLIEKLPFTSGDGYAAALRNYSIDFIVLAGFLWKIPAALIHAYPDKIINIHPALLPKFGGKGMYGSKVHEAVIAAGETESGITIHYVDEIYDHGKIIFQARCKITKQDTAASLTQKVHLLEHEHYAPVIAALLKNTKGS